MDVYQIMEMFPTLSFEEIQEHMKTLGPHQRDDPILIFEEFQTYLALKEENQLQADAAAQKEREEREEQEREEQERQERERRELDEFVLVNALQRKKAMQEIENKLLAQQQQEAQLQRERELELIRRAQEERAIALKNEMEQKAILEQRQRELKQAQDEAERRRQEDLQRMSLEIERKNAQMEEQFKLALERQRAEIEEQQRLLAEQARLQQIKNDEEKLQINLMMQQKINELQADLENEKLRQLEKQKQVQEQQQFQEIAQVDEEQRNLLAQESSKVMNLSEKDAEILAAEMKGKVSISILLSEANLNCPDVSVLTQIFDSLNVTVRTLIIEKNRDCLEQIEAKFPSVSLENGAKVSEEEASVLPVLVRFADNLYTVEEIQSLHAESKLAFMIENTKQPTMDNAFFGQTYFDTFADAIGSVVGLTTSVVALPFTLMSYLFFSRPETKKEEVFSDFKVVLSSWWIRNSKRILRMSPETCFALLDVSGNKLNEFKYEDVCSVVRVNDNLLEIHFKPESSIAPLYCNSSKDNCIAICNLFVHKNVVIQDASSVAVVSSSSSSSPATDAVVVVDEAVDINSQ